MNKGDFMYEKKTINKKYIILIAVFVVALVLGITNAIIMNKENLSPFEKSIKDATLAVTKILYKPVDFVKEKMKEHSEKQDLYEKYKELEKKVKETDLIQSEKEELEREVENLKKTLELNQTLSESSYLNATVVNRNLGYWYNTITIDKGSYNGVEKDMPVIVSEGLIGKVTKVTNFNSTVKLITSDDVNNKTSVKIKVGDKFVYGLLSGYDKQKRTFIVEGISDNTEIPKDSVVTTTGMGDSFPSGIVVGKVKRVTTDNFDLAKTVEVTSSVDYDDLSFVTILKRKA
jgi:rod shape-determining protein MreC